MYDEVKCNKYIAELEKCSEEMPRLDFFAGSYISNFLRKQIDLEK